MKKLALDYLFAAYGPDKLNNPEQAEPLVQRHDRDGPERPHQLLRPGPKMYEDAGRYDEAEETLLTAPGGAAERPERCTCTLAGYYNRQGQFDKTMEALDMRAQREPNNPEAFYTIATFYWDKAYRDFRLPADQKAKYVDDGLVAVEKALSLRDDYLDAVAFKNLLLREKAKYVKDRAEYDKLIAEANRLQQRAVELQKRKTAGIS
jgi:tetratricopeptide (TPR) repeat protein